MDISRELEARSQFRLLKFISDSGDRLWTDYLKFMMKRVSPRGSAESSLVEWAAAGNDIKADFHKVTALDMVVIGSILHKPEDFRGNSVRDVVTGERSAFAGLWSIITNGVLTRETALLPENERLAGHVFMCVVNRQVYACHTRRDVRKALGIRKGLWGGF